MRTKFRKENLKGGTTLKTLAWIGGKY